MNCSFTEKISSLIDGELSPAEAREVERHLLTCGECEQLRADFLNLRSQIAGFETDDYTLFVTAERRRRVRILFAGFAPTPSPAKPSSVMGVSITRRGPNSCSNPLVTL